MPLDKRLVLNQWMLGLFNVVRFEQLKGLIGGDNLEGVDAENISKFHHVLKQSLLGQTGGLSPDLLLAYDQNIVRHWKAITERRNRLEKRVLYQNPFERVGYMAFGCLGRRAIYAGFEDVGQLGNKCPGDDVADLE